MHYDFNGNLTNLVDTLPRTDRWAYDANGRNTETLDAGGLRLARGVGLAGDMGTLVAVTHHAGSSTNGVFYAHHNHRGDITLTRAGTATVGRYGYSAFGILHSALGPDVCRFKFSSKERETATGFSYYGYRFYAPQWQRWCSTDPGRESEVNLFRAFDNAPIWKVDPNGQSAVSVLVASQLALKVACAVANFFLYRNVGPPPGYGAPADAFKHCNLGCHIARSCGLDTSFAAGLGKELFDLVLRKGNPEIRDILNTWIGTGCALNILESCESCCNTCQKYAF